MKYNIASACDLVQLEIVVNTLMESGWEPIGGVVAVAGGLYAQAMIHRTAQ